LSFRPSHWTIIAFIQAFEQEAVAVELGMTFSTMSTMDIVKIIINKVYFEIQETRANCIE